MRSDVREELMDQIRDMKEDGYNYSQIQKILGVKISKINSIKHRKGDKKHGQVKA